MTKPDVVVEGRIVWINAMYRDTAAAINIPVESVTHDQVWDYMVGDTQEGARCSLWLIWYRKDRDGRTRQDVVGNVERKQDMESEGRETDADPE